MANYSTHSFPSSRIATIDVCAIGKQRHHICILLECDVTESRFKIRRRKSEGCKISFTAWLLKVISKTLKEHDEAAAFLLSKKEVIVFDDINISLLVEKSLDGKKVPMPLVIEKADKKNAENITREIEQAKKEVLSDKSVVLNRKSSKSERLYYHLPSYIRRMFWKIILKHPQIAYNKMGNVAVTSVGMFGQIKGWFIHTTIHPISFGVGSVIKKPVVVNNDILIREILNLTVLIDHDVIDGAPMIRFINDLVNNIEKGEEL
ncbi:MAG: 2-oxo acid dehydrogenase subunit E2 [Bacteroidota bacterium]|nr:2-oxo acid dehydrogenase subunit E2 [Bacteroidota bacterium]